MIHLVCFLQLPREVGSVNREVNHNPNSICGPQFNNGVLIKFQFQMSSVEQSKLIRLLQELEDVGPELFSVLNNPPFPENPFNRRLAYHRDFTFKVNDTFRFPRFT